MMLLTTEHPTLYLFLLNYEAPLQTLKMIPFKHQPPKMVRRTQTIRRQHQTNCLSVLDHFVGFALKGITCI